MQSPTAFFGFTPGSDRKIIHWDRLSAYYRTLAAESDRIKLVEIGKTTLGKPFLELIISSPDNLSNLDFYRRISMLTADPRGLDERTVEKLCEDGRAVCVQSMSLHADEIGGAQMAPLLAYELASSNAPEILSILKNVIFIMIPSFNPDGLEMVADWYDQTLGTRYEGSPYPKLWHPYGGHSNNRDAIAENLVESRYVNQILLREWMPQAYQDHHHQGSYNARMFIVPYKDPVRPNCSPLVWRELAFYGASMARQLEEDGVRGVVSSEIYPCRGHFGFHYMTNAHNIAGMLTESASARLATPLYVHPEQLPDTLESTNCPNPWRGGEWKLSDIVRQQYIAAISLLSAMAKNRKSVLRCMTKKAFGQTRAGADNLIHAYLIPPEQPDPSAAEKLVHILERQGIELYAATEPVQTAHGLYPAGTVIVPLAQPKYAVILTLLAENAYPQNRFTIQPDGSVTAYDVMSDNIAAYMGVEVVEAGRKVGGKVTKFSGFPHAAGAKYIISGVENESYKRVNAQLKAGRSIYRAPNGDFYAGTHPEDAYEIVLRQIGVYQTRVWGNTDEGYTRLLLEQYGFPYRTVEPGDLLTALDRSKKDALDVLILPSNTISALRGTNTDPELLPEEYRQWLGEAEEDALRTFVREGGVLLALDKSVLYAISLFGLNIRDRAKDKTAAQYNTHGSMLRVRCAETPLTMGMPAHAAVFHWNAPVLEINEHIRPENYRTDVRFERERVLESGLLVGEELLAGRPCVITVKEGKGEIVLYACAPQFRAQTDGTYKLLFNALYRERETKRTV
ncbi:MAG: peptidase M14 family protein [Clostridiales bacterium]|nr:peptidase M14 family protein [Clostridiales bacterium]